MMTARPGPWDLSHRTRSSAPQGHALTWSAMFDPRMLDAPEEFRVHRPDYPTRIACALPPAGRMGRTGKAEPVGVPHGSRDWRTVCARQGRRDTTARSRD